MSQVLAEMRLFFHKATVDAHFYRGYLADNEEICEALEAGELDRAGDLLLAYLDRSEETPGRRPRASDAGGIGVGVVLANELAVFGLVSPGTEAFEWRGPCDDLIYQPDQYPAGRPTTPLNGTFQPWHQPPPPGLGTHPVTPPAPPRP